MINNNEGYLHLILGPMFAGKSTKLFNIINNIKKDESFLIIKHIKIMIIINVQRFIIFI
jgi:thymidine kinase